MESPAWRASGSIGTAESGEQTARDEATDRSQAQATDDEATERSQATDRRSVISTLEKGQADAYERRC